MSIGAHIDSSPQNILDSVRVLLDNDCKNIQLFVNRNSITKHKDIYKKFKILTRKNNMLVSVHASYTINISKEWAEYSSHIIQFLDEIKCAAYLRAKYIVIHIGKQMKLTKEEAYNNMFGALIYICEQTKSIANKPLILLETSTGQGTELCYKLPDLAYFYNKLISSPDHISKRFGICLDTCHIFQAGYDITNKLVIKKYLANFDKLLGIKNIKLIHVNDAKYPLGSHKDRHANIGKGYIGKTALLNFIHYLTRMNCHPPLILETPNNNIVQDINYLKI
jgi:deoxyribonuclease-4